MTICQVIELLRREHERHGDVPVMDDSGREIIGVTVVHPGRLESIMLGPHPSVLVSGKRDR